MKSILEIKHLLTEIYNTRVVIELESPASNFKLVNFKVHRDVKFALRSNFTVFMAWELQAIFQELYDLRPIGCDFYCIELTHEEKVNYLAEYFP